MCLKIIIYKKTLKIRNMKKFFTFLIINGVVLFLITNVNVFTQETESTSSSGAPVNFGVKAGFTMSGFINEMKMTSEFTNSFIPGGMGGGYVEYPFNDKFSVQLETYFSQFGGSYLMLENESRFGLNLPVDPKFIKNKVTLNSLYIPLLFKAQLPLDIGGTPVFYIGPDVTYNIYSELRQTYIGYVSGSSGVWTSNDRYEEVTELYEPLVYGGTAGIGIELDTDFGLLLMDLRYHRSITLTKEGYSYIDLNDIQEDLWSHSFYFTLGYGF